MTDDDGSPLDRLKVRREGLADTAVVLELAITSAAGDPSLWRGRVREALEQVRSALTDHIEEVEASGGLYDNITASSPRLLRTVEQLRRDHIAMAERIQDLEALLAPDDTPVGDVRDAALALMADISRHRHRGADLIWEFYDVDIGGGG